MTEDQWRPVVLKRLRTEVGGEWFIYPRTRYGTAGVSDILGCVKGRFVAIELKMDGSAWKVTSAQEHFLNRVDRHGGYTKVAKNNDEVTTVIKEILQLIADQEIWL